MIRINHSGATDIGRVRKENEDRWVAHPDDGLYIVADGMGGALGGGLASQIVCETLPLLIRKRINADADLAAPDITNEIGEVLAHLSNMLRDGSRDMTGLKGMGSTVVVAILRGNQAVVAHMGDSRAYLLRGDVLKKITRDHSVLELLLESGEVSEDEIDDHPMRGKLTRFVGMPDDPLPESRVLELLPQDILLLCTDGLTGPVSDEEIRRIVSGAASLKEAGGDLIREANDRGGKDNVTALLIQWIEEPDAVDVEKHLQESTEQGNGNGDDRTEMPERGVRVRGAGRREQAGEPAGMPALRDVVPGHAGGREGRETVYAGGRGASGRRLGVDAARRGEDGVRAHPAGDIPDGLAGERTGEISERRPAAPGNDCVPVLVGEIPRHPSTMAGGDGNQCKRPAE